MKKVRTTPAVVCWLNMRVTRKMKRQMQSAARRNRMSVSDWVRKLVELGAENRFDGIQFTVNQTGEM